MHIVHRAPAHEHRIAEETSEYAHLSRETLEYMWGAAAALHAWLRWHGRNLRAVARAEHDLYEAMRLCARLTTVGGSTVRLAGRLDDLEDEMLRRELDKA